MRNISDFPRNTITLSELQTYMKVTDYSSLVTLLYTLMEKAQLTPIKNSGLNGRKPALYQKYRIHREIKDYSKYQEELLYQLDPMLDNNYYKNHLETYQKDRLFVLALNEYIKNHKSSLQETSSYNERSFEIWGREKFLLKEGGIRILKYLGLTADDLNVYETSEPLAYYSHHKEVPQKIVILENKDTFYSMRRHLLGNNFTILGDRIGTLIYGGGKSIYKSFQDFTLCLEPYMNDARNEILYFGDLDYEGIHIYETLQNNFKDKVCLAPFCKGYQRMLDKANIERLPITKEGQNRNIGEVFFSYFSNEIQSKMKHILQQDKYVPQEILQKSDF